MPFDLTPFSGIFPAGMTFFDADGNLNETATLDHWHWLVEERQADGLVICGTSGEFISLTLDERHRLFALATEHFAGKLPLIAGSGHASTKITIESSQHAQKLGFGIFPPEPVPTPFRRPGEADQLDLGL